jgi:hypothetical protein
MDSKRQKAKDEHFVQSSCLCAFVVKVTALFLHFFQLTDGLGNRRNGLLTGFVIADVN